VETIRPHKDGVCDSCGAALIIRKDDTPDTIVKRLEVYRAQTEPLIDYYKKKGLVADIDAAGGIDEVLETLKTTVLR
jgi:adenylate kinase